MMKRFTFAAAIIATVAMVGAANATTVNWVGGNGTWYLGTGVWDDGNANDGSASGVYGRNNGWETGNGPLAGLDAQAVIDGAGSVVYYNGDAAGDLRWKAESVADGGGITVSGGATFNWETDVYPDGAWMQFDAAHFTVTGAGSNFTRYNTPNVSTGAALNGGALIFGSWKGYNEQVTNVNVLDGGLLDNKGQIWFGAYGDEDTLNATLTIGTGATVKNRGAQEGGIVVDDSAGAGNEADFDFVYSGNGSLGVLYQSTYRWNFAGHAGNVDLGVEGIRVQVNNGSWTSNLVSGSDLWNGVNTLLSSTDYILQTDGLNKATAASSEFNDYFIESGVSGTSNYKLTSISGATFGGSNPGDVNADFLVDGADAGIMFSNWSSAAGVKTVSEGDINSSAPGDDLIDGADAGVLFANWTGDPGPTAPGSAIAEYNPSTGQIIVTVNGVNNWYVESTSGSVMTGDAPINLPQGGGAISDSDIRVGETGFIALFSYQDVNVGNVAATGLANDGSLKIYWNTGLGTALQSGTVAFVPEPTTLALAGLALCGVMATRRRRLA